MVKVAYVGGYNSKKTSKKFRKFKSIFGNNIEGFFGINGKNFFRTLVKLKEAEPDVIVGHSFGFIVACAYVKIAKKKPLVVSGINPSVAVMKRSWILRSFLQNFTFLNSLLKMKQMKSYFFDWRIYGVKCITMSCSGDSSCKPSIVKKYSKETAADFIQIHGGSHDDVPAYAYDDLKEMIMQYIPVR